MTRVFLHDGLAISVEALPADLEWLEEFLWPAFVVADSAAKADVHVTVHPATARRTDSVEGSALGRIAFALESGPLRFRERVAGGRVDLFDADDTLAFTASADGMTACVVHGTDHRATRIRLMRVVREYAHNHSIQTGGLVLHAAAVTMEGQALAIAGAKGAGKTTLTLRLLAAGAVEYLSNDRVLVRISGRAQAFAVPTVIAVRPGTRRLVPELAACLGRAGDFLASVCERRARGPAPPDITGETWRASAEQVDACLGSGRRTSGTLTRVLFPSRTPLPRGAFRVMDSEEAAVALADAVIGRQFGSVSHVFRSPPAPAPDRQEMLARTRALAAAVPCIVGHLPDAASSSDAIAWIAECLRQAR